MTQKSMWVPFDLNCLRTDETEELCPPSRKWENNKGRIETDKIQQYRFSQLDASPNVSSVSDYSSTLISPYYTNRCDCLNDLVVLDRSNLMIANRNTHRRNRDNYSNPYAFHGRLQHMYKRSRDGGLLLPICRTQRCPGQVNRREMESSGMNIMNCMTKFPKESEKVCVRKQMCNGNFSHSSFKISELPSERHSDIHDLSICTSSSGNHGGMEKTADSLYIPIYGSSNYGQKKHVACLRRNAFKLGNDDNDLFPKTTVKESDFNLCSSDKSIHHQFIR